MDKNCPRRSLRPRRCVNYSEDSIHFHLVQRSIANYWYERQQMRQKLSRMYSRKRKSSGCDGLIIKDDDSKSHSPQAHGNGNQIITYDRSQSSGEIESTSSMDSSEERSDC